MSAPSKQFIASLAEQWANGERLPTLAQLASTELGRPLAPATVRYWIVKHLGKAQFAAANAKRTEEHPRTGASAPPVDDSQVPVIYGTPIKKGWKLGRITVRGVLEDVFVSPDGTRYVRAAAGETADLIVDLCKKNPGLPVARLRLEASSRLGRKHQRSARREQHLVEQDNQRRKARQIRRKK